MKAISMWQPHASLVVDGHKRFETRGRQINYRGPVLIHAAKRPIVIGEVHPVLKNIMLRHYGSTWVRDLHLGAIIGVIDLVDCHNDSHVVSAVSDEWFMGDWSPGRWFWRCENARRFARPIPYRGMQATPFDVPDEVVAPELAEPRVA